MPAYEIASVRRINMSREYHATLATHVDMFCFEGIMNHDIIHIKIAPHSTLLCILLLHLVLFC